LNERAIQTSFTAAAGSAGATISRLCECTVYRVVGQPPLCRVAYSSRKTSSGFWPRMRWLASQPAAIVSPAVANHAPKFIQG